MKIEELIAKVTSKFRQPSKYELLMARLLEIYERWLHPPVVSEFRTLQAELDAALEDAK